MSITTGDGKSPWSSMSYSPRYEFESDKAERYIRENPAPRKKSKEKL